VRWKLSSNAVSVTWTNGLPPQEKEIPEIENTNFILSSRVTFPVFSILPLVMQRIRLVATRSSRDLFLVIRLPWRSTLPQCIYWVYVGEAAPVTKLYDHNNARIDLFD